MLGDTGQTKTIEAGRPFHQLQAAGNASASLAVMDRKLKAMHSIDDNGARHAAVAYKYPPDDRRGCSLARPLLASPYTTLASDGLPLPAKS